jgi:hypothetical protein
MKTLPRIVVCVAVTLAGVSALSAQKNASGADAAAIAVTSKDKQTTIITAHPAGGTPYVDENAGENVIFSNFATAYPNGVYWCCEGLTVSGPYSPGFVEWWHAAAFTPAANATVAKVIVPVQLLSGDHTNIILSLNADNGGLPGTVLEEWNLNNLSEAGTCCAVQSRTSSGIALTAGQQYWIVGSTGADSDVFASWSMADNDQVDSFLSAGYTNQAGGGQWIASTTNLTVAFAVLGK